MREKGRGVVLRGEGGNEGGKILGGAGLRRRDESEREACVRQFSIHSRKEKVANPFLAKRGKSTNFGFLLLRCVPATCAMV